MWLGMCSGSRSREPAGEWHHCDITCEQDAVTADRACAEATHDQRARQSYYAVCRVHMHKSSQDNCVPILESWIYLEKQLSQLCGELTLVGFSRWVVVADLPALPFCVYLGSLIRNSNLLESDEHASKDDILQQVYFDLVTEFYTWKLPVFMCVLSSQIVLSSQAYYLAL